MKIFIIIFQVFIIQLFVLIGTAIKTTFSIPIPASMLGLLLLFLGLKCKMIKLEWVELGGNWLLGELLLFFIPSAVGIVNYNEILNWKGVELVFLIALSTITVMGCTAYISEKLYMRKSSDVL